MKVIRFNLQILVPVLCLLAGDVFAKTLPPPDNLISLTSEQGEHLLLDSEDRDILVSEHSVRDPKNKYYCGVASVVMVLNALGVEAPWTPEFEPYNTFTQDNVLNEETEKLLPQAVLMRRGMTLDQIGRLLEVHSVKADVHHAADSSLDEFRRKAYAVASGLISML
jgi:hypothetical protein